MTYEQAIGGVSNSRLLSQRKALAVAMAAVSGSGWQNLDIASLGGGRLGGVDPEDCVVQSSDECKHRLAKAGRE